MPSLFKFLRERIARWRERRAKLRIYPGDFDDLNPPS